MELRDLRAFVAVAEQGGVARAASSLYLSPSTVSERISTLEAELGVALFDRYPRGMSVTEVGRSMLEPARRALEEIAAFEAASRATSDEVVGRITIVPGRLYIVPVVELVEAFHAEHPLVVVSLHDPENAPAIVGLIRDGTVDFAVLDRASVLRDFDTTPFGVQTFSFLVPRRHPLSSRAMLMWSDLDEVDVIAPPTTSPFRPMFEDAFRAGGIAPHVVAESDDLLTIIELVRSGLGLAFVPAETAVRIAGDDAAVVPLDPARERAMVLVSQTRRPLTSAAQAFWEFAQDRTGSLTA